MQDNPRLDLDDETADILRELQYCAHGPGWHFAAGQVARAQTVALERGWLVPCAIKPGYLSTSPTGKRLLAAWETGR